MGKNCKRKIALFPANYEAQIIFEHSSELKGFEISSIVTYKENDLKFQNKDNYTNDSESVFGNSDGLVLCDNVQKFGKKAYLNRIREAAHWKIPIYTSSYVYHWIGAEAFEKIETEILNRYDYKVERTTKILKKVTCPVISILGDSENCDKFSVLLALKKVLEEKGYKVLAIAGNALAKLFGCETLPDYLYGDDISMSEKVKLVNKYIADMTEKILPDIVLIGHPGGIMTLNDYEDNYFGEISYILSNAVISDYGIFCSQFSKYYNKKYFEEMKNLCKFRLGIDILKFYVCNQTYNIDIEEEKIEYNFYSNDFCKENLPIEIKNSENILLPKDEKKVEKFVEELICILNENPEII